MHLTHRNGAWFITDMPDAEPDCGPYDTRKEAESDRIGMERTAKYENRRGFVTSDPKSGT